MTPVHDPRYSDSHKRSLVEEDTSHARMLSLGAWLVPAIMFPAGLIAGSLTLVGREVGGDPAGLPIALLAMLIMIAGGTVVGLLGLLLVCALFKSEAGLLTLGLARLAGLYAVIITIYQWFSPTGCFGIVITGAIFAGLIALIFELELTEGVAFVFFNGMVLAAVIIAMSFLL